MAKTLEYGGVTEVDYVAPLDLATAGGLALEYGVVTEVGELARLRLRGPFNAVNPDTISHFGLSY